MKQLNRKFFLASTKVVADCRGMLGIIVDGSIDIRIQLERRKRFNEEETVIEWVRVVDSSNVRTYVLYVLSVLCILHNIMWYRFMIYDLGTGVTVKVYLLY